MVFSPLVSVLLALLPLAALGGQVPVVDGLIGGGRITQSLSEKILTSTSTNTTVAGSLRVTENPGICETTPGVYSATGYVDVDTETHIWFWFFAARHNSSTAPLTIWMNGGPGSSSMIGLFQEHGPCRIRNDSSGVDLNPMSWNEVSNILYIDQPAGVGYSYGGRNTSTSLEACDVIWKTLQIFLSDPRFSEYGTRDFAIWTESYGGHYGPICSSVILDQNAAIAAGTIQGIHLNLTVLGIGNGLTDPISQYPEYIDYSLFNKYHRLTSIETIANASSYYYSSGGCRDQIVACNEGLVDTVCSNAQYNCNANVLGPAVGNWDVYYVPTLYPDPYPPNITGYLTNPNITAAIGAESTWTETNITVYFNFFDAGDWMKSSIGYLEKVINAGVRTMLYDGDADYICNYLGVEAMISSLNTSLTSTYAIQPFSEWTVNGTSAGRYKNAGTFSYVRVYQAGHEVAAYKIGNLTTGEAALSFFSQVMSGKQIHST